MCKYGICKLNFYKKVCLLLNIKKKTWIVIYMSTINVICTNDFLHNFSRLLKFLGQLITTDSINAILKYD